MEVKRTFRGRALMSAFDPKRTSVDVKPRRIQCLTAVPVGIGLRGAAVLLCDPAWSRVVGPARKPRRQCPRLLYFCEPMPVARRRRPARGGDIDEAVIAWRRRPNDFRLGTAEVIQAIIRYSPSKITTMIIEELYPWRVVRCRTLPCRQ